MIEKRTAGSNPDTWSEDLTAAYMAGVERGRSGREPEIEALQNKLREAYAEAAAWIEDVIKHCGDSMDDTYARRRDELLALSKEPRP